MSKISKLECRNIPDWVCNAPWLELSYDFVPLGLDPSRGPSRADLTLDQMKREHCELVDKCFAEIAESASQLSKFEMRGNTQ